ncbi:hypothetical protein LP414_27295 [Polaromonas sp. P1(28)-13]|nr:hypothetical protein LP414_27295 [Polaromonas sp. P1(28)-13]
MTFLGLLGIVFITLKLLGLIGWSWWLVVLPLYAGLVFWLVVLGGVVAFFGLFGRGIR